MKRLSAAIGTALLSVGLLAGPAIADPGYNPELNKPQYWENYLKTEKGYTFAECKKYEKSPKDAFTVPAADSDAPWVLLVLKSATVNDLFENPEVGKAYSTESGKDISHAILCKGTKPAPSPEPTPTPTETTPEPTPEPSETTPEPTPEPSESTPVPSPEPSETTPVPTTEPTPEPSETTAIPVPTKPGKSPKPAPQPELPVTGLPALGLLGLAGLGIAGGGATMAIRRNRAK